MKVLAVVGMLIVCLYAAHEASARRPVDPATCLPDIGTSRVLSLSLPGGADRHVDEFWVSQALLEANRSLATSLSRAASPGYLMQRQVGQWKTYSYWRRELFCVIQVRASGAFRTYGLLTMTDYGRMQGFGSRIPGNNEAKTGFEPPQWWPALQANKVERWLDAGRRVTTITGFSAHSVISTRDQLVRAAARGGLVPSAQMQVPASAIGQSRGKSAGLMLFFQGPDRELAVTLTAMAHLTSVVAHLEEH